MKKRKATVMESEEEECSSQSLSSDEESDSQEIVNVDFEFFDPKPDDFHGAKSLLRAYLDNSEWDISGFVDLVLNQHTVGSIVKAGEDGNPIGLVTALNIKRYKDIPSIQAVKDYLLKHAKKMPEYPKVDELCKSDENVGLLVCERVLNLPIEVGFPLYKGLFDEISWATEDEPTEVLRNSYKFKQYLIVTRVYQEKSRKEQKGVNVSGGHIFIKPEEEIFFQLSSWHFTFPVKAEAMSAHETKGLKLLRLVMAVNAKKMNTFMTKFKDMIESSSDS